MIRSRALVGAAALVCGLLGATAEARVSRPSVEAPVQYEVAIPEPASKSATVSVRIRSAPAPLDVLMPAWSPGAYRLIHHGRFVQPLEATGAGGRELAWTASGDMPGAWRIDGVRAGEPVVLRYRVECDRLTEEGSRITEDQAYLNGPSLLIQVPALRESPATLRFQAPKGWRIATALDGGPEVFRAGSYDELVDGPMQLGRFGEARVTVSSVKISPSKGVSAPIPS